MRMMMAAALLVAGPVAAQTVTSGAAIPAKPGAPAAKPASAPGEVSRSAPVNGVLTLFGNERCPTNAQGEEIVICVRRSAQEQYRVPKELREFAVTPENESWAAKAQGTLGTGVGANSIGSCSTVGPGGATGCFGQRVREARRENKERAAEVPVLP
ncbi:MULTISPECIES: hypothetical protein [Sphingomonas]|jgi:hypothetical protein|uniref:Uncharacterized protein n=1 Tax=Sphingomonas aerolata TaxID=185951 RepID=A0A2T4YPJ7_9SPHN|nr:MULTISPECIES: hypothetical protein [Sphingomonas]RZM30785.1 MAG: hypothetical protein EOP67_36445 [Sphingomonas sp.]KQM91116.1 hypothetical protein ASE77_13775 [Sphingomonas sp. Leaf226]MBD8641243.1 hypothetical protein [Sphingomonas sp. CFBP 13733]MDY0966465.1 hypothetical protein [Sphingomonas sp. CFBP9021]PTM45411.1 hypothetical protein C8J24_1626 [Sphingomonas aerolata]